VVPAIPAGGVRRGLSAAATAAAGPLLIVAAVLVVLHDFAFGGLITFTQGDLAAYWLPSYCHLGRSLAAGHIPAWNPYSLAGAPFAADPQSGWMYLPAMALFSVFSCDVAIRLYVVLLPVLGGLGTYWFLRSEGVGRVPATVGGLVLSLGVAGSRMAVNLPFSATLAWTPLLLAAAARYLKAGTWPARLVWLTVAAMTWGQLAAAHLSHGFVIGSGALFVYVVARAAADVRDGKRARGDAVAMAALLVPALLLVNLAFFLPRVAYLPRATLGQGYAGLQELADRLAGRPERPFPIGPTAGPRWPFLFAISPGPYLGAVSLVLSFAGWWSRRHRALVVALGLFGLVCYVLSLGVVARFLEPVARVLPLGDFYLYSPFRFRYALFVVLPLLAGLGLDAWARSRGWRVRAWMLVPGAALWWLVPVAVGVRPERLWLLAVGAVTVGLVLAASVRRPRLLAGIPLLLAVELAASGLIGQASPLEFYETGIGQARTFRPLTPLLEPTIDAAAAVRPGPLALAIRANGEARYLSLNPTLGYLGYQDPEGWPFLTDQRSMLFGIEEAQGYNPVQPLRYWSFIRAANPAPELHNVSILLDPPVVALDLLGVGWLVAPAGGDPEPGAEPVAREGAWVLYRRSDPPPRASVVRAWDVVATREEALAAILRPGFDSRAEAILEGPVAESPESVSPSGGFADEAAYRPMGPQAARVEVNAGAGGLVVVRNSYDSNWHAAVDGRPVRVVPVDGFLQGVLVPAGRHTVVLTYDDPWIGLGLVGSGMTLAALAGAGLFLRRRSRASAQSRVAPSTAHAPADTASPTPTASSS
jgi:hypothetical protein